MRASANETHCRLTLPLARRAGPRQLCVSCHAKRLRNSSARCTAVGGIRMTRASKPGSGTSSGFQNVEKAVGHGWCQSSTTSRSHKDQDQPEVCFICKASPLTKLVCSWHSGPQKEHTKFIEGREQEVHPIGQQAAYF